MSWGWLAADFFSLVNGYEEPIHEPGFGSRQDLSGNTRLYAEDETWLGKGVCSYPGGPVRRFCRRSSNDLPAVQEQELKIGKQGGITFRVEISWGTRNQAAQRIRREYAW